MMRKAILVYIFLLTLPVVSFAQSGAVYDPAGSGHELQFNDEGVFGAVSGSYVSDSGNIGLGTHEPTATLEVVGSAILPEMTTIAGENICRADGAGCPSSLYDTTAQCGVTWGSGSGPCRHTWNVGAVDPYIEYASGNITLGGIVAVASGSSQVKFANQMFINGDTSAKLKIGGEGGTFNEIFYVSNNTNSNTITVTPDATSSVTRWDFTTMGLQNSSLINFFGGVSIGTYNQSASLLGAAGNVSIGTAYAVAFAAPANGMIVQGNVGIGTWSPTRALDVNGDLRVRNLTAGKCVEVGTGGLLTVAADACNIGSGGIASVVEDTTPQLGGDLDLNGHVITGLVIGTNVQAYDADLTTWAGVTSSANGRSLVSAADYAAMRGLLDLEAGTDFYSKTAADAAFQPLDGDLTALAGLTSAANKIPYWTGSATAGNLDFKDEDDMTSNSATALPSQQSVKAYVDTAIAGVSGGAGGWTDGGTNVYASTSTDNVGIGTFHPTGRLDIRGDEVRIWTGSGTNDNATSAGELYVQGDLEVDGSLYGDGANVSSVNAATGDSATSFFSTGQIERARGGTGADTSAYGNGILGSNGSNATIDIDSMSEIETAIGGSNILIETEIDASSELRALMDDEEGTGALLFAGGNIGAATATTPAEDDNDTSVATTAYVQTEIAGLGAGGGGWTDGGTNVYNAATADNVGIGTTTPSTGFKVDVRGNAYVSGNVGIGTLNPRGTLDIGPNGTAYLPNIVGPGGVGGATLFTGNVGIGTTGATPQALYVIGTAQTSVGVKFPDGNTQTKALGDTKCIWIPDPTGSDDLKSIWFAKRAVTLTSLWCESDQTVTAMLQVDDGSVADVDGTDLTCDSTPPEDTSLGGDATLASGDRLDLDIASVSGTPTWVSICWTYTTD